MKSKPRDPIRQAAQRCRLSINRVTRLVALVLVSLLWTASGFAGVLVEGPTIAVEPPAPTTGDAIQIQVSGVWSDGCTPSYTSHSVGDDNNIHVYSTTPPPDVVCTQAITPWNFTVEVGHLPPNEYEVRVHINDELEATGKFLVREDVPPLDDCMATYSVDGKLHIPCVSVPGAFGIIQVYEVDMQQRQGSFTFDLDLESVKPR